MKINILCDMLISQINERFMVTHDRVAVFQCILSTDLSLSEDVIEEKMSRLCQFYPTDIEETELKKVG